MVLIAQKKIMVACLADPVNNPRPKRAIEYCMAMGAELYVICYNSEFITNAKMFFIEEPSSNLLSKIKRKIILTFTYIFPCKAIKMYFDHKLYKTGTIYNLFKKDIELDLIIVENLELLPFAFAIKGKGRILFDAREYYPDEIGNNLWFKLFDRRRKVQLCKEYLKRCDQVITVSEGLSKTYEQNFSIKPLVIRSFPYYHDKRPSAVCKNKIKMVYHGNANEDRKIDNLIKVVDKLDGRFFLDLVLVGHVRNINRIKELAANSNRVFIKEPVIYEHIIPMLNKYDIGLIYYEPNSINLKYCLPNKFFEYVQARLMLAIGPSPDMSKIVKRYNIGVIAEDFTIEAMAQALRGLSYQAVLEKKEKSDIAAKDLCFEKEGVTFSRIILDLLN